MQVAVVHEPSMSSVEVIERKGRGHPDSLADGLAEALSRAYALYTREHFGVILHHNFDKVGLLGGKSYVTFGHGQLTAPIRVLLNGRATLSVGAESIPVLDLLLETARTFLSERLPKLAPDSDLDFHDNLSTGSSPGHVEIGEQKRASRANWFKPRNIRDIREMVKICSNDTSVGCAFWPLTPLESLVLKLERRLTSSEFRADRPWLGTDIKVMACRVGERVELTLCIPQIADHVPSMSAYRDNLVSTQRQLIAWTREVLSNCTIDIQVNTKDDFNLPELYLTAIGSAIESGDEGLVGRGNRTNGLIAMNRPYSMEGACGKNPVYHVGKVYNVLAQEAAKRLYSEYGAKVVVWLVSQEGRPLDDPWQAIVQSDSPDLNEEQVKLVLKKALEQTAAVTEALVSGAIELW